MNGTVESRSQIDVRQAFKEGWFRKGDRSFPWWVPGNANLTITLRVRAGTRPPIMLAWTAMHFGGTRAWWVCPGCQRRCAILYYGKRDYRCRRCLSLGYQSQLYDPDWRLQLKAERIYRRLGGDLYSVDELVKPPRMRWKTFHTLCERAAAAYEASCAARLPRIERLAEKADR